MTVYCTHAALYVAESPGRGVGVFTRDALKKGVIVERARAVPLDDRQSLLLNSSFLKDYLMHWPPEDDAFVFGYAMLYNHDDEPSVGVTFDVKGTAVVFTTVRPVPAGSELFIHYHVKPWWPPPAGRKPGEKRRMK
jgi:hypothetical protein